VANSRHIVPDHFHCREIRTYLRAEPFRKWSQEVHFFSSLSRLTIGDHKRYLRALLYPARFLYSWKTGAIGSNDEAVAFLQNRTAEIDTDLVLRALRCRNQADDPQPLFVERSILLQLREMCKERIASPA
jgi:hypothetical protein